MLTKRKARGHPVNDETFVGERVRGRARAMAHRLGRGCDGRGAPARRKCDYEECDGHNTTDIDVTGPP